MDDRTVTRIAATTTEAAARRMAAGRPAAKTRIGAGANIIAINPTSGTAPPARKNDPDRAAARMLPMIALRVIFGRSDSESRERKQCDHSSPFDRYRKLALMLGAVAGGPAGHDLAAFGDEPPQGSDVLIVDLEGFVGAEAAYLSAAARPPPHPLARFAGAFALRARRACASGILSTGPFA